MACPELQLAGIMTHQASADAPDPAAAHRQVAVFDEAVRALREAGFVFDFLGGTSMGGIIAAGVAMGWDDDELESRMRDAFVEAAEPKEGVT